LSLLAELGRNTAGSADELVLKGILAGRHQLLPPHDPHHPPAVLRGDLFNLTGDVLQLVPDLGNDFSGLHRPVENPPQGLDISVQISDRAAFQVNQATRLAGKVVANLLVER